MTSHELDRLFHPKTVAVVGANDREGSIGWAVMRNLIQGGFNGKIYPVNIKYDTVWNMPVWRSLLDLNESMDAVVICTPIESVPDIIKDSVQIHAGGAIIFSAGGKEIGEKGVEMENKIKQAAQASGLRMIGVNCSGIISAQMKFNASFSRHTPLPGKTAFISQSGSIYSAILDMSIRERIGFSFFVSVGSMIDVDFGDVIDYLGGEPNVSSILIYVENLTRLRHFISAARAISRIKPIIALKAGRSGAGRIAAASHTGAMAGDDAIYDAAFQRAGIVRVNTFEELFDCSEMLAKQPRMYGTDIAIISNGGGLGVIAVDALSDYGIEPVKLSKETLAALDSILPPYWSHGNPVDILANASPEVYRRAMEICLNAHEVNGVLILLSPHLMTEPTEVAKSIVNGLQDKKHPVFACWIGGDDVESGREILNLAGIPTFDSPDRAVRAFMDLNQHAKINEMLQQIPPKLPQKMKFDYNAAHQMIHNKLNKQEYVMNEVESKQLLAAYGIPVNRTEIARSGEDAWKKAQEIGLPVAVKILSPQILHKSTVNGVALNLTNEYDVYGAFHKITESIQNQYPEIMIDGVTVQSMHKGMDYELIIGAKKDKDFGPILLFGLGGTMTEVMKDIAIALPPLNRLLARRLMENTKIYRLLCGYRNYPAVDLEKLEEILIRTAQLTTDFPEIKELDINPIVISRNGMMAVDARVILEPSEVNAPMHLIISPYPNHLEAEAVTKDGKKIFIRPIRPEDATLFVDLFHALSPQSVYYRFFSPIKSLSHAMLARFTQIDYDREIALVAIHETDEGEQMVGVARVIMERNRTNAEFSVLVRDAWHGKGVGAELLRRCLLIAKEMKIETVWGVVLPENTQMLALGKKLGFSIKKDIESGDFELKINLTRSSLDL